ncbi:hypothetical protein [Blastococcus sp. SYSU DS0619]
MTSRWAAPCLVALVPLAGCGSGTSTGGGGCAGPAITVSAATVSPGSDLGLTAEHVRAGCNDTGGDPAAPARDVPISLVLEGPTGQRYPLGAVDADAQARIETTVRIPEGVPAGPARIEVGQGVLPVEVVTG